MTECYFWCVTPPRKPKSKSELIVPSFFDEHATNKLKDIQSPLIEENANYMQSVYDEMFLIAQLYQERISFIGWIKSLFIQCPPSSEYIRELKNYKKIVSNYQNMYTKVVNGLIEHNVDIDDYLTDIDNCLSLYKSTPDERYQLATLKHKLLQYQLELAKHITEIQKKREQITKIVEIGNE